MTPSQKSRAYRKARESANITAAEMAKALGLSRTTLFNRETGRVAITQEMAIAQAQILKELARSPEVRKARSAFISGRKTRGRPAKPALEPEPASEPVSMADTDTWPMTSDPLHPAATPQADTVIHPISTP